MTQLEEAASAVNELDTDSLFRLASQLSEMLIIAQNAPPEGGSDSTINEKDWNLLRDLSSALKDVVRKVDQFQETHENRKVI
jgi:hypothetical protein